MLGPDIRLMKLRLLNKSVSFVAPLEDKVRTLLIGWSVVIVLLCCARVAPKSFAIDNLASALILIVPHLFILASPIVAYWTANTLFPRGTEFAQPGIRLSRVGTWRPMDVLSVRDHPAFGPVGIMASLLLGIMLNVPVRTAEFMAGVPAMTSSAPLWGKMVYFSMSIDLVTMNFLYTLCFFMALRRVPFFPRMLLLAWEVDIVSQLMIAQYVSGAPGLPHKVADAIAPLLDSNVKKAIISIVIWMPYLILSERVNVTYRWRRPT